MPLAPLARHLFTTRTLSPGTGAELDPAWQSVAAELGLAAEAVWRLNQVHGCRVVAAGGPPDAGMLPAADAATSDRDDVALVVKVADCVPILLADRTGRGVAAVHAGWRGTAQNIAGAAVEAMTRTWGAKPAALVAAIGPSIGPCCYEVGHEVVDACEASAGAGAQSWFMPAAGQRPRLDLWRANASQLAQSGVPAEAIHTARLCTACHLDTFFSYRREAAAAGRMLAAIRKR